MAHLPASKARQGFADTINRVAFGKERVVLRRRGKEIAAVVPIDVLRLLEELEDRPIGTAVMVFIAGMLFGLMMGGGRR